MPTIKKKPHNDNVLIYLMTNYVTCPRQKQVLTPKPCVQPLHLLAASSPSILLLIFHYLFYTSDITLIRFIAGIEISKYRHSSELLINESWPKSVFMNQCIYMESKYTVFTVRESCLFSAKLGHRRENSAHNSGGTETEQ